MRVQEPGGEVGQRDRLTKSLTKATLPLVKTVNVHEAKTHLSRLLRRVSTGEEIVIAKGGKPIARLVPVDLPRARVLGSDEGRFVVPADFDAPLAPELLADFEQ